MGGNGSSMAEGRPLLLLTAREARTCEACQDIVADGGVLASGGERASGRVRCETDRGQERAVYVPWGVETK